MARNCVSAAMEAVLTALRRWRRGEPPGPVSDASLVLAEAHGLLACLHHIGADLSPTGAQRAEHAWFQNTAAHMLRMRTLGDVWPDWAPPPMIIKGADLSEMLYGDPGVRRSADLDLLLPDPMFEPVCAHLTSCAEEVRTPTTRVATSRIHEKGFVFTTGRHRVVLELHRDAQPRWRGPLRGTELWLRSSVRGPYRAPSPSDRLLLWLTNLANDGCLDRLRDWLDLAVLLDTLPMSPSLDNHIAEAGLRHPWHLAQIRLAQTGLGVVGHGSGSARAINRTLPHPCRDDPYAGEPRRARQGVKVWMMGW
ncbi:MAG: nucleotidyltransferase family protein [Bradymonadia bacterium]